MDLVPRQDQICLGHDDPIFFRLTGRGDSAACGVVCPNPQVPVLRWPGSQGSQHTSTPALADRRGGSFGGKLTSISSACAEDFASNDTFPRLLLSSLLEPFVLILGFPQPWKT